MASSLWKRLFNRASTTTAAAGNPVIDTIRQAAGPVWFAGRSDAPEHLIIDAFRLDFPDHPLTHRLAGSNRPDHQVERLDRLAGARGKAKSS